MATSTLTNGDNFAKTLDLNEKSEWVPLSLTLVEYPKGDLLGKLLALVSLAPFGVGAGFVALILFRRDLHTITFFVGTLCSELVNCALKHTIREARPLRRPDLYGDLHHMNNNTIVENVSKCLIIGSSLLLALLVCVGRVYLQYHTIGQVVCGAFVGALFATAWFGLTYAVLAPLFPQVVQWRLAEILLLRDTTLIPNVLWFEYTNARQEVRARSRKLVSMKSQ